jgi:hypothetical protein
LIITNNLLNYLNDGVEAHRKEIIMLLEKYSIFEKLCENILTFKISIKYSDQLKLFQYILFLTNLQYRLVNFLF